MPAAMMTASEPMEILYPVAPPPNAKSSAVVSAGPKTAETLPAREKRPKNSPSFSGGESATSMTLPTVHIPPSATPTKGPATKSIQAPGAPAASTMATNQIKSTASSDLFGPPLSHRKPKTAEPTTAKTV